MAVCQLDTHLRVAGTCVELADCQAGTIGGCYSLDQLKRCNLEGTAMVPVDCPEGQKCIDGKCGDFPYAPGQLRCVDAATKQECLADGSGWGDIRQAPAGQGKLRAGGAGALERASSTTAEA
ncbi:MAG: hypothetical protein FJ109_10705 [Deltaproteobacteria bacterium]|nr:hypothetical protein [Deltaproteobacteria bacterium]